MAGARSPERQLRDLTVLAALVAVGLMVVSIARSDPEFGAAGVIGGAVAALVIPSVLAAIIGWGNPRRLRLTFVIAGGVILLGQIVQLASS